MTKEEILKAVAEEQPELMGKTAQVIAITERLHPDFVQGIFKDFDTICSVVNEKTAAVNQDYLRPIALHVGGTVAGGLLGAIATDLYDAAKRGLSKGRNWERIMQANPNLKREVDKRQLSMAFDTIHRYAPDFTSDPLVGGALLKQVAELPQMSHKTIMELIGSQKDIRDGKGRHFQELGKLGPVLTHADSDIHMTAGRKAEKLEDQAFQTAMRQSEQQARAAERAAENAARAGERANEQAARAAERAAETKARASQGLRQETIRFRFAKKLEDYRQKNKNKSP